MPKRMENGEGLIIRN